MAHSPSDCKDWSWANQVSRTWVLSPKALCHPWLSSQATAGSGMWSPAAARWTCTHTGSRHTWRTLSSKIFSSSFPKIVREQKSFHMTQRPFCGKERNQLPISRFAFLLGHWVCWARDMFSFPIFLYGVLLVSVYAHSQEEDVPSTALRHGVGSKKFLRVKLSCYLAVITPVSLSQSSFTFSSLQPWYKMTLSNPRTREEKPSFECSD